MSHKHSLGIKKVTIVVPFIFESNPWVCIIIRNMTITSDETITCRFSQAGNLWAQLNYHYYKISMHIINMFAIMTVLY